MRRQPFFQSVRRQDFHSDREEAGFSVNSEGRIFIQKMRRKEVYSAGHMIFFFMKRRQHSGRGSFLIQTKEGFVLRRRT